MTILAVEFSSEQRSVAVAIAPAAVRPAPHSAAPPSVPVLQLESSATVLATAEEFGGRSLRALAMVQAALEQAGLRREEITCIAVGLGPGSYTGIRAAISLAQGWQLARSVQLLGLSSVESLVAEAEAAGLRGPATFVIDAQRGQYYIAAYIIEDGAARLAEPLHIAEREQVLARLTRGERVLGPDATNFGAAVGPLFPKAASLAKLAANRADFLPGERLEPIYLRQPQFVKAPPPRAIPKA